MKRVSAKRRREEPARKACLLLVCARANGRCEMKFARDCTNEFATGHEPRRRSQGGDETNPAEVFATCHPCHRLAHSRIALAVAAGVLISRKAMNHESMTEEEVAAHEALHAACDRAARACLAHLDYPEEPMNLRLAALIRQEFGAMFEAGMLKPIPEPIPDPRSSTALTGGRSASANRATARSSSTG